MKKRYIKEQIIDFLRQADARLSVKQSLYERLRLCRLCVL
jgi:hypothetical protein